MEASLLISSVDDPPSAIPLESSGGLSERTMPGVVMALEQGDSGKQCSQVVTLEAMHSAGHVVSSSPRVLLFVSTISSLSPSLHQVVKQSATCVQRTESQLAGA